MSPYASPVPSIILSTIQCATIILLLVCGVSVVFDMLLDIKHFKRMDQHMFYDYGSAKRDEECGTPPPSSSVPPVEEGSPGMQSLRKTLNHRNLNLSTWRKVVTRAICFVTLQFLVLRFFHHTSLILISTFGSRSVRFQCRKATIRGHDCGTVGTIVGLMNCGFGVAVLTAIRALKLHKMLEENANLLCSMLLVVLGLPIGLLKWHASNGTRGLAWKIEGLVLQGVVSAVFIVGCTVGRNLLG